MRMLIQVVRWLMGVMFIGLAMGAWLSGAPVAAIWILIGGLITLPLTGRRLGALLPASWRDDSRAIARGGLSLAVGFGLLLFGVIWSIFETPRSERPAVAAVPAVPAVPDKPRPASAPAPAPPEAVAPAAPAPRAVNPDTLMLIEGEGWDRTRNTWGRAGVERINELLPKAAAQVAASRECDELIIGGLSDERSRPRDHIVFYFDCANEKRFYVSEQDIATNAEVVSRNAQTAKISDSAAIETCERSVRMQLNLPSSYDRDLLNTSVFRSDYGTMTVRFTFQAKNGLGIEQDLVAECHVDDRGVEPAVISPAS